MGYKYNTHYVSPEQREKSLVETDTATQEPEGNYASIRQRSKKPKYLGSSRVFMLITNNAELSQHITSCRFINGTALDVLVHVRNLVHSGSRLITHPLCGNLRPSHQPFRSVIIDMREGSSDLESLKLIEEAVRIYQAGKIITPDELNDDVRKDYAYIDSELMRESLEQCRLFYSSGLKFSAPLLLMKEAK